MRCFVGICAVLGIMMAAPALAHPQAEQLLEAELQALNSQSYETPKLQQEQAEKRRKILYSLDELQRNPRPQADRYIHVNIPSYQLTAWDYGAPALISRVVVGGAKTQTPRYTSNLYAIKYNPDWHAPQGITKRYTEKIRQGNWKYFEDHHIRVTQTSDGRYRFSQPAGPHSALGELKFELDNADNIYLHDTNERNLFNRDLRAKSSGCVRVQDFEQLAAWVEGTTPDQIRQQINSRRTWIDPVQMVVPVWISYLPAWPDANGVIHYSNDIYRLMR